MDEDDYNHLQSGSNDLAGCVLTGANLSGLLLNGRNFNRAQLGSANFEGANLEGSSFLGATITRANFSGANLRKSSFNGGNVRVNFSRSNLSDATLHGVYASADFRGANLSGTNFSGVHFQDGCLFDDAIVSEETLFDGATVLRPYSRLPPFRYYKLERGILHRLSTNELQQDQDLLRLSAIDALTNGIQELQSLPVSTALPVDLVGIGHNNPPDDFKLSPLEISTAQTSFVQARDALFEKSKDTSRYLHAIETATDLARKASMWVAQKVDVAISEFAKEFGKTLGSKVALTVATLQFTGALERIVQALSRFIESIL